MPLMYVDKPQYWEIRVIGCVEGVCLTAVKPYNIWREITHMIGHKGILVVVLNKQEKFEVP